ncbi:unnamed protein product, partial [marine sediment metagenome]
DLYDKGYSWGRVGNIIDYWLWDRKVDLLQKVYNQYEDLYVDDLVTESEVLPIIHIMSTS